jgi:SAM-dependent methyltransferase
MIQRMQNVHAETVSGFGAEWSAFDQSEANLPESDRLAAFAGYFEIFSWADLPHDAVGADVGCGSGRWAALVASRVGRLFAVDPSPAALDVAKRNLASAPNAITVLSGANDMPFATGSLDFAYSLGVLHHVPDTQSALSAVVDKLKPGAPFLLYLYYNFENRSRAFRALWRLSDVFRRAISRMSPAWQAV